MRIEHQNHEGMMSAVWRYGNAGNSSGQALREKRRAAGVALSNTRGAGGGFGVCEDEKTALFEDRKRRFQGSDDRPRCEQGGAVIGEWRRPCRTRSPVGRERRGACGREPSRPERSPEEDAVIAGRTDI